MENLTAICANITLNKTTIYSKWLGKRKEKNTIKYFDQEKRTNGIEMSYQTKTKIKNIIESWTDTLQYKTTDYKKNLNFTTLTLPAKQMHTDIEINKILNRYLYFLKRKTNLKNYLWVAEKQKNGNIHYHVLIDEYIHWKTIRRLWNHELNKHGYIEAYRRNQKRKFKNGFIIDKDKLNTWSAENQLKAYNEGIKTNWSNPNSTDIHSLKKIKNVKAYVTKYMTKGIESEKLDTIKKKYLNKEITEYQYKNERQEIIKQDFSHLIVTSRKWNSSENLKKLSSLKIELGNECYTLIEETEKTNPKNIYRNDFVTIVKLNAKTLKKYSTHLYDELIKNIEKNVQLLTQNQKDLLNLHMI